ncbi:uncharacterized protein LOC110113897 isoform X1 [Dendrobium catenatum]|uniref:AT3G52170-like helix-turn-helix domain-containing protein n=2 Tax=Dendrobium catenatum TaxID=906689 RepID=A0A2I0VUX7_9ASPA|nr:uncharacterized protein LOC110113897 isoform X1 [Dendrobium catenatum]PKU67218.1 hypothetical protein MA16_Dca018712 [Dendrobium catenatum]
MQITARRFTSLSSRPRYIKEFFEVSNAVLQSSDQCCWSSSSAAVSSNSFSLQQVRKKVTKQERSAMVLAFVEKYRALNGGKFPTISCTQKQVGGSYYVVREIIQELEHSHKRTPLETKKEIKISEEKIEFEDFSLTKEPCILADAKQSSFKEYIGNSIEVRKQHSSSKSKAGTTTSRLSTEAHSDNQIERDAHRLLTPSRDSKESHQDKDLGFDKLHVSTSPATVKPQTHTSVASNTETMNVGHPVSAKLETKTSIFHTSTEEREVCRKDAASAANIHERAIRSEVHHGQRQIVEQGAQSTKRSIFWGNLKSIAVGIINLWKK